MNKRLTITISSIVGLALIGGVAFANNAPTSSDTSDLPSTGLTAITDVSASEPRQKAPAQVAQDVSEPSLPVHTLNNSAGAQSSATQPATPRQAQPVRPTPPTTTDVSVRPGDTYHPVDEVPFCPYAPGQVGDPAIDCPEL